MKKPTKRDTINLFFSAFLIIAFIVCAHFFSQYASALSQPLGSIIPILVYAVFGLLMFYATRVGDGKAVKAFFARYTYCNGAPVTLHNRCFPCSGTSAL